MNTASRRLANFLSSASRRSTVVRYGFAVICVCALVWATYSFTDQASSPYLALLLAAVAFSAAFGGFGPGIFATCAAFLLAFVILMPPRFTFGIEHPGDIVRLLVFVPAGAFISWLMEAFVSTRAELQRSEELFHRLAEAAPVGIFQTDAQGRWTYVNSAWSQISGIAAKDAIGLQRENAIHPDDKDSITTKWHAAAAEGEPYSAEYRYQTSQGNVRWVRSMASPVQSSGEFAGYICAVTDITDLIATQMELAKSEARFRQLADAMPQLVWTAEPDGFIDYYNHRWYESTGMPENCYGDESWKSILHPKDVQKCVDIWSASVRSGEPYQIEYRYRNKSGEYRWHLGRAVPVRDATGKVVKWFGTCTDIEDIKRAQADLLRAGKLASAGKLAASIAHELNNPLGAAMNLVYLARQESNVQSKDEYLAGVDLELSRASHLANRCLSIYRGGTSRSPVSLDHLVDDTFAAFETAAASRNIKIVREIQGAGAVFGSPDELRQVFINLVSNAIDATSDNGTVNVRLTYPHAEAETPEVQLIVADSGAGIPEAMKKFVFDAFFTTKGEAGTGLGLWVTRNIIENHGGTVRIRSSARPEHHGTVVSVRLPIVADAQAAA